MDHTLVVGIVEGFGGCRGQFERARFAECMASPQARAMHHLVFAEADVMAGRPSEQTRLRVPISQGH